MWDLSEPASGLLLLGVVAAPFVGAALLGKRSRGGWPLAIVALQAAALALLWRQPHEVSFSAPWIPSLGISFALRLDALAWVYAKIICVVGAAIFLFSTTYLPYDLKKRGSQRHVGTLCRFLLLFIGSMLGVVLSDDLFVLYAFWEATTIASFLLIAFHHQEETARKAGLHSLVVTGGSGLFLFVAALALTLAGGGSSLSGLAHLPTGWLVGVPTAGLIALCVTIAAAAKSAQIPLHGWLPEAMVAPTPVSALLHSATLVAAGVFLLARLWPVLGPLPGFGDGLVILGSFSLVLAGVIALRVTGLKDILAWSTISQYGYVVILIGLGAIDAAIFTIAFHAVAKAGLFLVAGAIQVATGKSDVDELGGLWRAHPLLAAAAVVLALGLAGFPPAAGFWMKELIFKEVLEARWFWVLTAALIGSILTAAYLLRFVCRIFFGAPAVARAAASTPAPQPLPLVLPPALLATFFLLAGLIPPLGAAFGNPDPLPSLDLSVHLEPFLISVGALALGVGLFVWFDRVRRAGLPGPVTTPFTVLADGAHTYGPRQLFSWFLMLVDNAGAFAATLQTGKLVHYLVFLTLVPVLIGFSLLPQVELPGAFIDLTWEIQPTTVAFSALALSAAFLAIASVAVRSHVAAILLVGGVGYVLALIFALLRAPDVALVQVVVETATALLLLAALSRIPEGSRRTLLSPPGERDRVPRGLSMALVIALGLVLFSFLHELARVPRDPTLGRAYLSMSQEVGAAAAVKAILVGFRAIDTLGEVTVFGAAVLGSALLLGKRRERRQK